MNMICVLLMCMSQRLFAAVPLPTTRLAEVETTSWYLIIAGFVVELIIMYILLRPHRENFLKILGVTIFMNAVSIFMGTVTVLGSDLLVSQILRLPVIISFAINYFVAVLTSVFTEVLIVVKLFPAIDRFRLILWLTIANMASIAAAMYGIWITRLF